MSNASAQSYAHDDRNDRVLVHVNGQLVPRDRAVVSIFDAGFGLGDGVWEGLRLVRGRILSQDAHLDRLYEGANAIGLDIGMDRTALTACIMDLLAANGMEDGVHIRLMVTRGVKTTINQDPRFTVGGATVVILAEWKQPNAALKARGLRLMTSAIRCSTPDVFDLRLNSHSRLNFIQALNQAIGMGADEALMLDDRGFVASCNSTNFFIVRGEELWTSDGACCFNGITRATVMRLWRQAGGVLREGNFTLAQAYAADEAFVTGTLGGITPVASIDGRDMRGGVGGPVTARIAALYAIYVGG
ncbi:aminotransferase class IV [Paracoccus sediminilitoris]|uniref:aminotransferase class IV n=1 Tax=Paracoccus sediminilitoris TaxID=2202419 RepID=UPI000DBA08E0|nr:aminotransferase class IV [Paracoccus sediminilitoris]